MSNFSAPIRTECDICDKYVRCVNIEYKDGSGFYFRQKNIYICLKCLEAAVEELKTKSGEADEMGICSIICERCGNDKEGCRCNEKGAERQ